MRHRVYGDLYCVVPDTEFSKFLVYPENRSFCYSAYTQIMDILTLVLLFSKRRVRFRICLGYIKLSFFTTDYTAKPLTFKAKL